jgi:cytochrome c oxidase cbb3-type subunit 2
MKNGLALFTGAFATLALSWGAVVLTAHKQYGSLAQYKDPLEETLYPQPLTGLANQGRRIYQDLGCVSCHTQQVRRDGFGADVARGWGGRQSVARDYIREQTVLIGSRRYGPDLRNVGARITEPEYFYKLLHSPASIAPGQPAYPFLFETRKAVPGQPSVKALKLGAPAGYEIVPTPRAEALVAYLMNLKDAYEYPEAKPFVAAPAKKEGGH